jgi:competence protein ComGC
MRSKRPNGGVLVVTEAGCEAIKNLVEGDSKEQRKSYRLRSHSSETHALGSPSEVALSRRNGSSRRSSMLSKSSISSGQGFLNKSLNEDKVISFKKASEQTKTKLSFKRGFFMRKLKPAIPGQEEIDGLLNFGQKLRLGAKIIEEQSHDRELSRSRKKQHIQKLMRERYVEDLWDSIPSLVHPRTDVYKVLFDPFARWNTPKVA